MRFPRILATSAVALGAALATDAHAAVTVETGAFITTPLASNDFEAIGCCNYPLNTIYSQGGVSVQFVGTGTPVITNNFANGLYDFYTAGDDGYQDITLTDGSSFDQFQFSAASGYGSGYITYELLLNGSSIASGTAAFLPSLGRTTLGFSGATFDEVRLQARSGAGGFDANAESALFLDDILIDRAAAGVPELSTWALMMAGFAGLGATLRRRRGALA